MRVPVLFLVVACSALACEKNEPKQEEVKRSDTDAGLSKVEALDPNLAEAVAAASVAVPDRGAPPPQVDGGPPPDGVFAPGAADKELPRGGMPKITLGNEGSAPKVQLGVAKAQALVSGTIQIAQQSDPRQGAIPVLMTVTIEPKKLEAAGDAAKAPVAQPVALKVTGAKIDAPNVPKDVDLQIAKLRGSRVEYSILPGGAGAGFRFDAPKDAPSDLRDVVRSLSDAIALLTIPYPDKPLGAGAYFMVTSRDDFLGLDLVSYRLVKVKQVTADVATLEVNTKRYAASRSFDFPGLPPEIEKNLVEFQATSEGTVELPVGALLPTKGEVSSVLAAQLGRADVKQRAMLQLQTRTQLDLK
ncbi:MAG TPA: hypothetical protein VJN18_16215 [Polyangiaceae bacterium]|nr:hypothetical protein [Polyangiaceae bacterium]